MSPRFLLLVFPQQHQDADRPGEVKGRSAGAPYRLVSLGPTGPPALAHRGLASPGGPLWPAQRQALAASSEAGAGGRSPRSPNPGGREGGHAETKAAITFGPSQLSGEQNYWTDRVQLPALPSPGST
jgi:hypothetical protein